MRAFSILPAAAGGGLADCTHVSWGQERAVPRPLFIRAPAWSPRPRRIFDRSAGVGEPMW